MTALSAFCCAISEALLPVIHPPNPKPTSARAAAPPTAPHMIDSTFGDNFMEKFMADPFARSDRDESQRAPAGHPVGLAIFKLEGRTQYGRVWTHEPYAPSSAKSRIIAPKRRDSLAD